MYLNIVLHVTMTPRLNDRYKKGVTFVTYLQGKSIGLNIGIDFRKLMLQSEQNAKCKTKNT